MNDRPSRPTLSDDQLDLAASLAIDGQDPADALDGHMPTPAERREIEARTARLRSVVDAVAAPVAPPTTERRAAQLEAAAAALGRADPSGAVTPISTRTRRRPRARAVAPWAVAAAIAAVIAVAVSALTGQKHERYAATSAAEGGTATVAPTTTVAPVAGVPQYGAQSKPATAPTDLGSFADAGALAARARDALSSRALTAGPAATQRATASGTVPASTSTTCSSALRRLAPRDTTVVYDAEAVLGTNPVRVVVYAPATGAQTSTSTSRTLVVVDTATCHVLVDRPL